MGRPWRVARMRREASDLWEVNLIGACAVAMLGCQSSNYVWVLSREKSSSIRPAHGSSICSTSLRNFFLQMIQDDRQTTTGPFLIQYGLSIMTAPLHRLIRPPPNFQLLVEINVLCTIKCDTRYKVCIGMQYVRFDTKSEGHRASET